MSALCERALSHSCSTGQGQSCSRARRLHFRFHTEREDGRTMVLAFWVQNIYTVRTYLNQPCVHDACVFPCSCPWDTTRVSFVEACQAVNVPRPYPTPAHTPDPVDLYNKPPFVCPAYLHPSRLQRYRSSVSHCRPQTGTVPMGRCPRAHVARDPKVGKEVSKDRGEI